MLIYSLAQSQVKESHVCALNMKLEPRAVNLKAARVDSSYRRVSARKVPLNTTKATAMASLFCSVLV